MRRYHRIHNFLFSELLPMSRTLFFFSYCNIVMPSVYYRSLAESVVASSRRTQLPPHNQQLHSNRRKTVLTLVRVRHVLGANAGQISRAVGLKLGEGDIVDVVTTRGVGRFAE